MKTLLCAGLCVAFAVPAFASDRQVELRDRVMEAAGSAAWPGVKRLKFTFRVEDKGKEILAAAHDWDLVANTDTVEWKDKKVTVKLDGSASNEDEKAAFQRWTNDSYWLLMPLKLGDKGVVLKYGGKEARDGTEYEILDLSFGQVGLTSKDQYRLYIDPKTYQVRIWDYMPAPDQKKTFTWDGYKDFNGLVLATEHEGGERRIYFTDIAVER